MWKGVPLATMCKSFNWYTHYINHYWGFTKHEKWNTHGLDISLLYEYIPKGLQVLLKRYVNIHVHISTIPIAVLMSNNKLIEKENVQLYNSTQILNETMLFIEKWMELGIIILIKQNNILRKTNTICFLLYFVHKI